METKTHYLLRIVDREGVWFVNRFEVKYVDGKLQQSASGSNSENGATLWEEQMGKAILAFLTVYNPNSEVILIPA